LNEKNKQILLDIARTSVRAAVTGVSAGDIKCQDEELKTLCGCFVTLKNAGDLRGCIGQFVSEKPLHQLVCEMAAASATHDSRFFSNPITSDELDEIDIELSVLSPLEKTDNPGDLRLGIDGIYIVRAGRTGCFLPQVATETGWTTEEFLSYCCQHKAGLEPDAWKDPETEVYLFTADVYP
jgi:AmmeMemoRadiSam system protein A